MSSDGKCKKCGFVTDGICHYDHFKECLAGGADKNLVFIYMPSNMRFWMYLECLPNTTLQDLDIFLKNKWLKCCETHPSRFTCIKDPMTTTLSDLYKPPKPKYNMLTFGYEYDYGSESEISLSIELHGKYKAWTDQTQQIVVLARNEIFSYFCKKCKLRSYDICKECRLFLCTKCINSISHKCDKTKKLKITNTPRMGLCNYIGDLQDDE
jgi:hypothetical protein